MVAWLLWSVACQLTVMDCPTFAVVGAVTEVAARSTAFVAASSTYRSVEPSDSVKNGLNPLSWRSHPKQRQRHHVEALARRGAEAIDQGEFKGPGQRGRPRHGNLPEKAARRSAADLLVERAGRCLREIAGNREACCRPRRSGRRYS